MNMTELHRRLTKEDLITFNRQYLSQLAGEGKIPYKVGDNGRKVFKYIQVVKALMEGSHIEMSDDMEKATITSSKIELYYWRGKLVQLEHDKKAGILLDRDEVERKAFEVARVLRDQLLALPERLSGELSVLNYDECLSILNKEFSLIVDSLNSKDLIP